jgi:outer membrane protein OmpA-like peptidoglycan-associated protein
MTRPISTLAAALVAVAVAAPAAHAVEDIPHTAFYVGVFGGVHSVLDEWDLHEVGIDGLTPSTSASVGMRLGVQLSTLLAVELGLGVLPYKTVDDAGGVALSWGVDGLFHLMDGGWQPYLGAGLGFYHNVAGPYGPDIDYNLHWMAGIRGMVGELAALRMEFRHLMTDSWATAPANNFEATFGVDFFAWRQTHPPKVVDTDGDGIADPDDACPTVAGVPSAGGCPDQDGDGVADDADKCPELAGTADRQGCPDKDGDGILDGDDQCPDEPGVVDHQGCPPPQDGDGDGVIDAEDRCPSAKGPAAHKGCPDSDRDGVADIDDKCPDEPGVISEQGCLPEAVKKFSGAIKGITFVSGSARIKKSSNKQLDLAAKTLSEWPTIKLRIEGHTDDHGPDEVNLTLSQARAVAVRDYLIGKGIDAARLKAQGFGETKPVADNKKAAGRAQNRRIEFIVIAD